MPAIANNKAEEVDSGVMMVIVPPLAARSSDTNQPDVNAQGFKPERCFDDFFSELNVFF